MKNLIYRFRAWCWHSSDAGMLCICAGIILFGIISFIICLNTKPVMLFVLAPLVIIGLSVTMNELPDEYRIFLPNAGDILYYYKYDETYCIISRHDGRILYYDVKTKKVKSCKENDFFTGRYIIQIGFDKDLKKIGNIDVIKYMKTN